MTRVGHLTLGVLTGLALGVVTLCNGQSQAKAAWPAGYGPDTEVTIASDGRSITISKAVAIVSRSAATRFAFKIGSLPEGHKVEVDFEVQGTRKGPFARAEGAADPQGRFTGGANATLTTGPLTGEGREVWKYEVVLRDAKDNHVTAIDPMIVIME
jgi:hypothetical protein